MGGLPCCQWIQALRGRHLRLPDRHVRDQRLDLLEDRVQGKQGRATGRGDKRCTKSKPPRGHQDQLAVRGLHGNQQQREVPDGGRDRGEAAGANLLPKWELCFGFWRPASGKHLLGFLAVGGYAEARGHAASSEADLRARVSQKRERGGDGTGRGNFALLLIVRKQNEKNSIVRFICLCYKNS